MKRKTVGGSEVDLASRRSRRNKSWGRGETARIKAGAHRRERRSIRHELVTAAK
ncbi:MAG: hypothetical protein WA988_03675 [Candidatus Nanopelagicales bacterium]